MTVALTVLSGVFVFVIGQIILKLIIEPVQDLKRSLGSTSHVLLLNQAKLTNATSDKDIATEVKLKSAEIIAKSYTILWYPFVRLLFGLPSRCNIIKASKELNSIYYGMLQESKDFENSMAYNASKTNFALENTNSIAKIGRLLKLRTTYDNSK